MLKPSGGGRPSLCHERFKRQRKTLERGNECAKNAPAEEENVGIVIGPSKLDVNFLTRTKGEDEVIEHTLVNQISSEVKGGCGSRHQIPAASQSGSEQPQTNTFMNLSLRKSFDQEGNKEGTTGG